MAFRADPSNRIDTLMALLTTEETDVAGRRETAAAAKQREIAVGLSRMTPDDLQGLASSLEAAARHKDRTREALSAGVEILRLCDPPRAVRLARRITLAEPLDWKSRYRLTNCLHVVGGRTQLIEAIQQRLVGAMLDLRQVSGTEERRVKAVHFHRRRLSGLFQELHGGGFAGRPKIKAIRASKQALPLWFLERLSALGDGSGLPREQPRAPAARTVVLDNGAISHALVSQFLRDPRIRFAAPVEVLGELARWPAFAGVPIDLPCVDFLMASVPRFLNQMRPARSGKWISKADRAVVALAVQLKADSLVTDDSDIVEGNVREIVRRERGWELPVIRRMEFDSWVRREFRTAR